MIGKCVAIGVDVMSCGILWIATTCRITMIMVFIDEGGIMNVSNEGSTCEMMHMSYICEAVFELCGVLRMIDD